MSVSQNLLAFFSSGSPQIKSSATSLSSAESADAEGLLSFAEVLGEQQPEEMEALMQLLGDTQGKSAEALSGLAELAAAGKNLPAGMQEWLAQLDELRSETEDHAALVQDGDASAEDQQELGALVEDWSQWLDQAREFIVSVQNPAAPSDAGVDVEATEALVTMASLMGTQLAAQAAEAAEVANSPAPASNGPPAALAPALSAVADKAATSGEALLDSVRKLQRGIATGLQPSQDQSPKGGHDGREPAGNNGLRAMAERTGPVEGQQPTQRNLEMAPAASEGRAAFAGKLAETIEALGGRQVTAEPDSTEAALRPGVQTQAAAQGALAARPVLAAPQTLNVPFGQAGWGDAVMDKMMWMSSQNLRSVEIRLDPADLGPLEIHIQTRGQEHQVQFVTQNPSVREALEAQMFRLREAFSQQGMDLVDVSVGDSAAEQQTHHNEGEAAHGRRSNVAAGQGLEADEAGMLLAAAAVTQAESTRLVDYYA